MAEVSYTIILIVAYAAALMLASVAVVFTAEADGRERRQPECPLASPDGGDVDLEDFPPCGKGK